MTAEDIREKPENPTEVLKKASDAILEKGIDFTISVANPNILHKLIPKYFPLEKKFIVKPLYYGTTIRMSKIIVQIGRIEKINNHVVEGIEIMARCADLMIDVIAIALINSKKEPSKRLKNFLKYNLTHIETKELLNIVAVQMRTVEFLQSIILIKGLNQMENLTKNKMDKAPQTENIETSGEQSDQQ